MALSEDTSLAFVLCNAPMCLFILVLESSCTVCRLEAQKVASPELPTVTASGARLLFTALHSPINKLHILNDMINHKR